MGSYSITPPQTPASDAPAIAPDFPHPSPSLSFWHKTTRAYPYLNINSPASTQDSSPLPSSVKYAIIGSGISGALTAFELLQHGINPQDVVILEAREAVSGASGRNAGHVRPDAFRGYSAYAKVHGAEQALKIVANEKLVLERIDEFVRQHQVPCDFHLTTTFDVCLTQDFADYEATSFREYQEAGGDVSHIKFFEGEESKRRTRVKDAVTAYEWPAGSSHPAKLAQWLLANVIQKGVKLYTHTPVTSVIQSSPSSQEWTLHTPRGNLTSTNVIHCTNAYAAALLPQLSHFLTPNRAQAHSLTPTTAFSGSQTLPSTMSLRYSLKHFYSLIQRQGDGTLILGVSRSNPDLSAATYEGRITFDDSSFNHEIVDDGLKRFAKMFPEWNQEATRHGEGLDHAWSGIIGMTPDSVPCVGAIEELPGQFICAGFNGHGMARIFTCAPGLVKMMMGAGWEETGLPECFKYDKQRLRKGLEKGEKGSIW